MDTTNEQSAFGSIDDSVMTAEKFLVLIVDDTIEAAKRLAAALYNDASLDEIEEDGDPLGDQFENAADGGSVLGFSLKTEYRKGGGEGQGDHVERVLSIRKDDQPLAYVRVTGHYNSYEGTEWDDDLEVVYPHQVLVTKFRNYKAA